MKNKQHQQNGQDTSANQPEQNIKQNKQPTFPLDKQPLPPAPNFEQKNTPHHSDVQPKSPGGKEEKQEETTEETDGGTPAGFIPKEKENTRRNPNALDGSE